MWLYVTKILSSYLYNSVNITTELFIAVAARTILIHGIHIIFSTHLPLKLVVYPGGFGGYTPPGKKILDTPLPEILTPTEIQ